MRRRRSAAQGNFESPKGFFALEIAAGRFPFRCFYDMLIMKDILRGGFFCGMEERQERSVDGFEKFDGDRHSDFMRGHSNFFDFYAMAVAQRHTDASG